MSVVNVESQLTGNVWKIEVSVGDKVSEGDVLLILESMKMEIPLMATEDGIINEIKVEEGDVLSEGNVAVVLSK